MQDYPYKKFKIYDSTPIAVEVWNDQNSVEMHCHKFYEFTVITRGSCIHHYRGIDVPLVPGDVFLIEPNQPHGYDIQAQVNIVNCMFYPDQLSLESNQMLKYARDSGDIEYKSEDIRRQWDEILRNISLESESSDHSDPEMRQANLNAQGIIHLNPDELRKVEEFLDAMVDEQNNREINLEYAKSAYLQLILVILSRVQVRRAEKLRTYPNQKRDLIYNALTYIEQHFDEKIDFNKVAKENYMSISYFRTIFKDVTGLAPVDYLNRMRVVKSLEYLERDHLTIADAAAKVGVYDSNYFSRMFKKVMGYSPKYFKSIR